MQKNILVQRWIHSHEEDTPTETVYRPAAYNFPRSRGRKAFELKKDGELVEEGIAPTDGRQIARGQWKLERDNLILYPPAAAPRVLPIASAEKDRLVIKKSRG